MSRSALLPPVLVLAVASAVRAGDREAAEVRELAAYLRTVEEQGGRSHASGDRPELGPMHVRSAVAGEVRTIRVGLSPTQFNENGTVAAEYHTAAAHNHDRVEVTATGAFEVVDATGGLVLPVPATRSVTFFRAPAGLSLSGPAGPLGTFPGPLRIRPAVEGSVLVVNSIRRLNRLAPLVAGSFQSTPAPYRGELEVLPSTADPIKLRLVNVVELEDYVPGVVVNESLASFHAEALRAQAITARGYALANIGRFAERGFDVDDSTSSQVYRGQSSETAVALEAAGSTRGLVLSANGAILSALYSSSMGGHTESNEFVFPAGGYPGSNAHPALRAVHDSRGPLVHDLSDPAGVRAFYTAVDPDSSEVSPQTGQPLTSLHRWTRPRTAAELLARLKESFAVPFTATRITGMDVTVRGHSGRMMQVVVSGDWGATVVSGWSDLRRLASVSGVTPGGTGATSAPNSPSTVDVVRDATGAVASVVFVGGGFGHNVGMSQYGAQGRALRGQGAEEILRGYYTGAVVGSAPALVAEGPVAQAVRVGPGQRVTAVVHAAAGAVTLRCGGQELPLASTTVLDRACVRDGRASVTWSSADGPALVSLVVAAAR